MDLFTYLIIPIFIFIARVVDVTIGTLRVIFIARGMKVLAPLLGFFEVIIWLVAIARIMENLTNVYAYIAYGAGFAMGTFVGMVIEEKLSIGKVMVRIIIRRDESGLVKTLKEKGFNLTTSNASNHEGKVKIIFTVIDRKETEKLLQTVKQTNPKAFYTIEDVRYVKQDEHPNPGYFKKYAFGVFRKGK